MRPMGRTPPPRFRTPAQGDNLDRDHRRRCCLKDDDVSVMARSEVDNVRWGEHDKAGIPFEQHRGSERGRRAAKE